MRLTQPTLRAALACAVLVSWSGAFAQAVEPYESTPTLAGGVLAPKELLSGPLHTVGEPIVVEGFMGRYEIRSKFGKFQVAGVEMLALRVRELAAIEALDQVEKSTEFQQAFVRSAQAPVQFLGSAVTDPGGTVENVAAGVGTVLRRAGRLATTSAQAVGDATSDARRPRSQPQSPPAPEGEAAPPTFTGDPFGFNRARREWAARLDIDPYTTNPVLRPKLDAAASATFAGGLPVNVTLGVVAAPLQYATTFDGVVNDSVWNLPVIDLVARNEATLRSMGITGRPVRDFFRNRWFTPTMQTSLVVALYELRDVPGRDAVILSAASVQGEARARALVGAVRMLGRYHREVAPLSGIRASGIVAVGSTAQKALVVATDLDHVWWNAEAADFSARRDLAAKRRTLLVSGSVSPAADRGLAGARWDVKSGFRPVSRP